MKPLQPATVPESETDRVVAAYVAAWHAGDPALRQSFATADEIPPAIREEASRPCFVNDIYQVSVRLFGLADDDAPPGPLMAHLSIKRLDKAPVTDWRDKQEIKNQLVGPECEAVEIYPAESRLVDTANQYHLWCFLDQRFRLPFGFDQRLVSNTSIADSRQRVRPEHSQQGC